jgi:hypothetical protein
MTSAQLAAGLAVASPNSVPMLDASRDGRRTLDAAAFGALVVAMLFVACVEP